MLSNSYSPHHYLVSKVQSLVQGGTFESHKQFSGRVHLWTEFCPTSLPNTLTKVPGSIKNLRLWKSSTQTSPKIKLPEMADWRGFSRGFRRSSITSSPPGLMKLRKLPPLFRPQWVTKEESQFCKKKCYRSCQDTFRRLGHSSRSSSNKNFL